MNGREGVKGVLNDGEDNMMDIVMMDTAGDTSIEMLDVTVDMPFNKTYISFSLIKRYMS